MGNLWLYNGYLYRQTNFAAPEETEDGIALVQICNTEPQIINGFEKDIDAFYVRRDSCTEVSFSDVQKWFDVFDQPLD